MSWTDDEIDALFKEIPTQLKPAPFQDSFFDEIEPLLPQKRSKKGLFWVLGATLIALVSTLVYKDPAPALKTAAAGPIQKNQADERPLTAQSSPVVEKAGNTQAAITETAEQGTQATKRQSAAVNQSETAQHEAITQATLHPFRSNPVTLSDNTAGLPETVEVSSAEDLPLFSDNTQEEKEEEQSKPVENSTRDDEALAEQANETTPEEQTPFISPAIDARLSLLGTGTFQADEQTIQALYLPMLHRKQFITLEAGAGLTENFIKMENSSQRPMQTASLGLAYQYRTKHLIYSAGLNWMNFSPNSLTLNRESKVYGFEVNHYKQNIDYQWITMLEMPLSIGKRFNNQNISIGFAPAIVLGSMVDFTKTENGQLTENSRIYGNMLGLKQYTASVSLAYDLQIARNLNLGVKVSNLLINPLDESRFVGQLNKNPFQAQITIKKHFRIK